MVDHQIQEYIGWSRDLEGKNQKLTCRKLPRSSKDSQNPQNLNYERGLLFTVFGITTFFSLFFSSLLGESHSGFIAEAAVLYWQAREGGVATAFEVDKEHRENSTAVGIPFEWDFGFKVGLGYRIPHDHWEGGVEWTSLQTHSDLRKNSELLPIWSIYYQEPFSTVEEVNAHWRLHLGIIDIFVRKKFKACSFVFVPGLGIGMASIRQKYNIAYQGGETLPDEGTLIRMKNKFWGIGPYCGLSGEWGLKWGLSLYGKGVWRLLCGSFYLHQDEDLIPDWQKILGVHYIYSQSSSVLQGELGLLWSHQFSKGLKKIELRSAWDQVILFSQNQLIRFVEKKMLGNFVSNLGNLTLAGVEFSCRLDF